MRSVCISTGRSGRAIARVLWPLVAALVPMGCAGTYRAYDGPVRPSSEVVTIKTAGSTGFVIWVTGVGEREIGQRGEVQILPGSQNIRVLLSQDPYATQGKLAWESVAQFELHAMPGASYVIQCVEHVDRKDLGQLISTEYLCIPIIKDVKYDEIVAFPKLD